MGIYTAYISNKHPIENHQSEGISQSAGNYPDKEIRQNPLVSATESITHQRQSGKINFIQNGKEKPC